MITTKTKLYMAVTADDYELPLCVRDKPIEIADAYGLSLQYVYDAIYRHRVNRMYGIKFVKVEVDNEI